jgi:RNA polymerase sigma-70 factor (sigma-E family)
MTEATATGEVSADAFDCLLRERSASLLRTSYLLTGDRALAEDLLRTALAGTRLRWRRLGDPEAGEAYALGFMARKYSSRWRRRWDPRKGSGESSDFAGDPSVDDGQAFDDDQDALRRALGTLSKRQRAMVVLRYHRNLTEDETADVFGTSVLTVRSTVARALDHLRDAAPVPSARPRVVHLDDPVPQRTATK